MALVNRYYRMLSYALDVDTPMYGGGHGVRIKASKRISSGDSCNMSIVRLSNHAGTHVDCPNHFYDSGKKISGYKIRDFVFKRPFVLDCQKSPNGLVSAEDIERRVKGLRGADILLLRTGFHRHRGTRKYSAQNPGISPEAAVYIRRNLRGLKCVGIDTISVSPYGNRALGRETHRVFFKKGFRGEPVRLIEDMDLSGRMDGLKEVHVFPLFMKDVDSSPCAVMGIFEKR
ncbi:MAG: cyclase family protein [Candidatus Omnitrophota bacterium]